MPDVLTIGTFAPFHEDHGVLLSACRQMAGPDGEVLVGINSVAFVERHKGFTPESPVWRAQPIMNHGVTNNWFVNDDDSIYAWIHSIAPDILAVGSDWASRDYLGQIGMTWKQLWHLQCNIAYVPSLERVHSSDLRKDHNGSA